MTNKVSTEPNEDDEGTWEKLGDNWELDGKSRQSTNYPGMKGTATRRTGGLERDLVDAESRMDLENIGDSSAMMEKDYKALVVGEGGSETMGAMSRRLSGECVF